MFLSWECNLLCWAIICSYYSVREKCLWFVIHFVVINSVFLSPFPKWGLFTMFQIMEFIPENWIAVNRKYPSSWRANIIQWAAPKKYMCNKWHMEDSPEMLSLWCELLAICFLFSGRLERGNEMSVVGRQGIGLERIRNVQGCRQVIKWAKKGGQKIWRQEVGKRQASSKGQEDRRLNMNGKLMGNRWILEWERENGDSDWSLEWVR